MDKNSIKKYAIWARRELIERVSQKALQYGITPDGSADINAEKVNGRLLSDTERKQRSTLIIRMKNKGYEQVIEEVAYTWFNRFAALRFMEVNGYLPSHVRVFTNDDGEFKPQILTEAIHLELEGLDMEKVYELKQANKTEELYKYLLIVQCNALSSILPGMFQRIEDYTELLLPDNLLREGSVIEQMVSMIPENDWTDQVQIIGWLYQYYNTEPKDKVFENLKKNIKITKENIPAATQLFTPDWIVRYMVENSLGRLWLEGHPNDELKAGWKYYLDEAEQEPEVQKQLAEIRKEYAALKPEDIKCIDPCMGSGHILCYMFDVLVKIYEDYGYTAREAVAGIIEKNLWGLDIDERAAQLAYFAVMMKARQYDARFFKRNLQPHIHGFRESNGMNSDYLELFGELKPTAAKLMDNFHDAMEYGSLIKITLLRSELSALRESYDEIASNVYNNIFDSVRQVGLVTEFRPLLELAEVLSQKYDAVITNPPYMGNGSMSDTLLEFAKTHYSDSKMDMFAMFIDKCGRFANNHGFYAMITQPSFLFLSSFEKLRKQVIEEKSIVSLLDMGRGIFGIDFGSTSFVIRNYKNIRFKGGYFKLYRRIFQFLSPEDIAVLFLSSKNNTSITFDFDMYDTDNGVTEGLLSDKGSRLYFESDQEKFTEIPNTPFAYWVSERLADAFVLCPRLESVSEIKHGMSTGNNDMVLRAWMEVNFQDICFSASDHESFYASNAKYAPYNKGGDYRKWYGNQWYVIGYDHHYDQLMDSFSGHRHDNKGFYFKEGFTWSTVSAGDISLRYSPIGFVFDSKGSMGFTKNRNVLLYTMAFINSSVCTECLRILSPTIDYNAGSLRKLPYIEKYVERVASIVLDCIKLAKDEWDSYETSWDYRRHPLLKYNMTGKIEDAYKEWKTSADSAIEMLKHQEEELNRIFINTYDMENEISPEVETEKVTPSCRPITKEVAIITFISYAVGCMMGRYSLDFDGLVFAGGTWDASKYKSLVPDADGILPICDDEYFNDDIVGKLVLFVEHVFGKDALEENLSFIASALGGKGAAREVIRNYFLTKYFSDHCDTYSITGSGKRPIYWLFDSGKKNGFKALIYMHRYQPDTIARIRTDYVHEQQSRYRTAIADLENRITSASTAERVKLTKQLSKLQDQAEELRLYEEKIHHLADQMIKIDLDDGVKVNYAKFQDVLAKIK